MYNIVSIIAAITSCQNNENDEDLSKGPQVKLYWTCS